MARMFCTLKEAAAWLDTTEPQLKTMLAEGTLPEFRDGANQLVRVSDVRALAAARPPDERERQRPYRSVSRTVVSQPTHASEPQPAADIRLPRSATAVLSAPAREAGTAEWPDRSEPSFISTPAPPAVESSGTGSQPYRCREVHQPFTLPQSPVWPRPRADRAPVRKGLWMGVIDDRPSAILTLVILVVGVAAALAAGAYYLIRLLR